MSASPQPRARFGVRSAFAVVAGLALTAGLWVATTRFQVPTGFAARYFDSPAEGAEPFLTTIEPRVSSAALRGRQELLAREWFRAQWDGVLRIETAGTYRFSLLSGDSARLSLDDQVVVNHPPGPRQTTVPVRLERGVHALRVTYVRAGENLQIELLWSPGADGRLTPLTGVVVSPTARTRSEYRFGRALALTRLALVVVWAFAYWGLGGRFVLMPLWHRFLRHHAPGGLPRLVIAWLAVVAVLYAVGLAWGWPGPGWVPNELSPAELFAAMDQRFSAGWWSWYGPVHFYLLAILTLPLYVWQRLDGDAFYAALGFELVTVMARAVSVAMAVATVLMIYLCGVFVTRTGARRAGTDRGLAEAQRAGTDRGPAEAQRAGTDRGPAEAQRAKAEWPAFVAMALASLSMPMVFYAKTANMDVPYLFWFALSLVSLARIAEDNSKPDYVLFAVTGMLAVCTKDQAYGLFSLPALGVAARAYHGAPGASAGEKFVGVVRDRWVLGAVAAGMGTFVIAHNFVANVSGFMTHLRYIQTGGIDGFRMFALSADGIWQLWRASWMLIRVSVGWPAFVVILAGLALSLAPWHRRLWWMLLPAVSYFVTYAVVVRYTYDRFLLPVLLMLALAATVTAARLDLLARGRRWPRVLIGMVIAYTFVYVMAVDAAMVGDSRYDAERWLQAHAQPGARIGLVGGPEYMPRIEGFAGQFMRPVPGDLESPSFDYIVLNLDWVNRFGPDRPEHGLFAGLRSGRYEFRQVFEAGADTRVAGLRFLDRFTPFGDVGYSTFPKIDPPLVIFERVR